jgi:hypothetical protein
MSLSFLVAMPNQAFASPLFSIDTSDDWEANLAQGTVKPVTSNYDAAIEVYNNIYGLDYLYTPPEIPTGGLYVYEGDGIPGSGTEDAGLVMTWGDPAPADPTMPQLAAWEYVYDLDPNLIGTTLKLTVTPPAGIWAVSLTLNDAALGWNTWDWVVAGSPLPIINPGAIPLPVNVPTTITINPVIAANQSGSNVFASGGFNPAIATTIQADELASGPGSGAWATFPTVPVIGGQQPWNYWSALSVISDINADQVCVYQESSPGSGDFDANFLGTVDIFDRSTESAAVVYQYDNPLALSYNGTPPDAQEETSQLFFVDTTDGRSLFVVHDKPLDGEGGTAQMRYELFGDPDGAARLVEDDPGDTFLAGNMFGPTVFQSHHRWVSCCTDGVVIGSLDESWSMLVQFFDVDGIQGNEFNDIDSWVATSADGSNITLSLEKDRRVKLQPCASIEKTLLEGPEQIGIYLLEPTVYMFEIAYNGPASLVADNVPSEFGVVECVASEGTVTVSQANKGGKPGKSATNIEWDAPAGSNTLVCTIQTRPSQGKGHKEDTVYKPTACGLLTLNDGAIAYEVDDQGNLVLDQGNPIVITGPTDPLTVDAVSGTKPCQPCDALNDKCIDADGTATAGRGDFNVDGEVLAGYILTAWPDVPPAQGPEGIDWFDNDGTCTWTMGDDIHVEGATYPTAIRNALHDDFQDPIVLDLDGSLDGTPGPEQVDVDLETGTAFPPLNCPGVDPRLMYYDTNGVTNWDDGEDIILDVNGDGIFN